MTALFNLCLNCHAPLAGRSPLAKTCSNKCYIAYRIKTDPEFAAKKRATKTANKAKLKDSRHAVMTAQTCAGVECENNLAGKPLGSKYCSKSCYVSVFRPLYAATQTGRAAIRRGNDKYRFTEKGQKAKRKGHRLRRALLANASAFHFTEDMLEQRMSMFANRCFCGAPREHVDHVKPLSKGGLHALSNLQPLCEFHNIQKHATWHGPRWAHELRHPKNTS